MRKLVLFICLILGQLILVQSAQAEMKATENARGTVAHQLLEQFGSGLGSKEDELFDYFMLARKEFEAILTQHGFELGDVGMAYGVSYVTLWELSNDTTLPLAASGRVVRHWSDVFSEIKTTGVSKAELDTSYDALLHTPIIFIAMRDAAGTAGTADVSGIVSAQASTMFHEIAGYPASIVDISADGVIMPNEQGLRTFLLQGEEGLVHTFLSRIVEEEKIDQLFAARRNKESQSKDAQSRINDAVQDTYTSIINTNTLMMFPNPW